MPRNESRTSKKRFDPFVDSVPNGSEINPTVQVSEIVAGTTLPEGNVNFGAWDYIQFKGHFVARRSALRLVHPEWAELTVDVGEIP